MNMIIVASTHLNKHSINIEASSINFFLNLKDEVSNDNSSDIDQLQIATCILLIEVSKSDDDFDIQGAK